MELDFVNPNYNNSFYDVTHYGTDGTVIRATPDQLQGRTVKQNKSRISS